MRPEPDSFEATIDRLNALVTRAFNEGDVKACAAAYAEDATLLVAERPPIKGRNAIAAFLSEYSSAGAKLRPVEVLEVRASGDMGCCAGRYEFTMPSESKAPSVHGGKFVTVFMRQSDGSWKAVVDSLIRE